MWKLVALAYLVVICSAQAPPRPNIPETFDANGPAEIHRGETIFGMGHFARDQTKGDGLEEFEFKDSRGNNETIESLERYDMGEEFKIRTNDSKMNCQVEKTQGTLPPFWGWVKYASYAGKKTIRHKTYDLWLFHAGGVRLEVGVLESSPNVPYYFARQESSNLIAIEFTTFNPTTPAASVFDVPSACRSTPMMSLRKAKTL